MEKKFVKGDKEYLVKVSLREIGYYNNIAFYVEIYIRQKGKRKWNKFIHLHNISGLNMVERERQRKTIILAEIPQEWIDEVKQMEIENISKSEYKY